MSNEEILAVYGQEMKRFIFRERSMETTRNLAVFILGLMIITTYIDPVTSSHYILFLGSLSVFALLLFDTHTQRIASVSSKRIALIEKNYFATMLDPLLQPAANWQEELAQSYFQETAIGVIEAFAMRIRDCYFIIFIGLDSAWIAKLYLYPKAPEDITEFIHRLDLGPVPGIVVVGFIVALWSTYITLLVWLRGKLQGSTMPR